MGDHWAITEEEAESLANPIASIVERLKIFEHLTEENADYAALILAAGMIVTPRIMQQAQVNKARKEVNKPRVQSVQTQTQPPKRTATERAFSTPAPSHSHNASSHDQTSEPLPNASEGLYSSIDFPAY